MKHVSILMVILIVFIISSQNAFSRDIKKTKDGTVEFALKNLSQKAVFYSFKTSRGNKVTFFALLDRQDTPHVAFNACDVCYEAKRGYTVTSESSICNNCKNQYPTRFIGTKNLSGGCWPSYIPIKITDNKVVIEVSDLEKKAYLFP